MARIRYESQATINAAMDSMWRVLEATDPSGTIRRTLYMIAWAEGLVLTTYRCTAGALTIGWGHNLDALPVRGLGDGSTITVEQANDLLLQGFQRASKDAATLAPCINDPAWYTDADSQLPRVGVLIDLVFNVGITRARGFKKFLAAFQAKQWDRAAAELVDSAWYKQVGRRSKHSVAQMQRGVWVPMEGF